LLASERAARSEAERANRLKDEFLATLSHELRTPLNAIVGWSQMLQQRKLKPEQMVEGLETIERNAKVQTQLISDLLDVSRITSGKMRLDMQVVDPSALVEAALTSITAAADAKGVTIVKKLTASAGPVLGDASRLQQVIWNLMSNAVKFTTKGGRIDVEVTRVASCAQIRVSDTGQGIKSEFLPFLFDPFRQ